MNIVPVPILILFQAVPFFVTLLALYHIIFKPMLQYLDERADSTVGARQKGQNITAEIEERIEKINESLKSTRTRLGELRAEARAEATANYNQVVKEARDKAEAEIKEAVLLIQKEQETAKKTLEQSGEEIAKQIAGQALGRELIAEAK